MNTQKQIFLIVVLLFTFVGGCAAYSVFDIPHRAAEQASYLHDQSVERGALLFANNCRTCHGLSGQGVVGPQLNTNAFRNQDPLVLAATRAMLTRTISCGRAGTEMPAWLNTNGGSLSDTQIQHIVDFLTEPVDPSIIGPDGKPESKGWRDAIQYGHNINAPLTALVNGDTLDTIAQGHLIGYAQLSAANGNIPIDQTLKEGSVIHIPGFKGMPNGYDYHVYTNNDSIRKIVDGQHYGAVLIADYNNVPYTFSVVRETATLTQLDSKGNPVTGFFPGTSLKLPPGAEYVVVSGDTLQSIAQRQDVSLNDILSLNPDYANTAPNAPLPSQRTLKLGDNATVTIQSGQAAGAIASLHNITSADLLKLNGLTAESKLVPGTKLKLPPNATYNIQNGDTLASVAALHNMPVDQLAQMNGLKPSDQISPQVVLKMPPINNFVVQGQTLQDIAKGFSGIPSQIAQDFATTNHIPVNAIMRVGQVLQIPLDSNGNTPPGTINDGTACVQYAVPNSVYQSIPGISTTTPTAAPSAGPPTTTIDITAKDIAFNLKDITIPAGKTITVKMTNDDTVPHNFAAYDKPGGTSIFVGQIFTGPNKTVTETFTAPSQPGTYYFQCDVHPTQMNGTLNVVQQ